MPHISGRDRQRLVSLAELHQFQLIRHDQDDGNFRLQRAHVAREFANVAAADAQHRDHQIERTRFEGLQRFGSGEHARDLRRLAESSRRELRGNQLREQAAFLDDEGVVGAGDQQDFADAALGIRRVPGVLRFGGFRGVSHGFLSICSRSARRSRRCVFRAAR